MINEIVAEEIALAKKQMKQNKRNKKQSVAPEKPVTEEKKEEAVKEMNVEKEVEIEDVEKEA